MYAKWLLCRFLTSLDILLDAFTTELLTCLFEVGHGATMLGVEVALGTSMRYSM
jgi:hypothetical protein